MPLGVRDGRDRGSGRGHGREFSHVWMVNLTAVVWVHIFVVCDKAEEVGEGWG